jgi:hypothetical protein
MASTIVTHFATGASSISIRGDLMGDIDFAGDVLRDPMVVEDPVCLSSAIPKVSVRSVMMMTRKEVVVMTRPQCRLSRTDFVDRKRWLK